MSYPVSLDKWRDYFSAANSDIFCIIEHAIMVAVSDCPYDFKLKRDRIAETLFSCRLTKCLGCNSAELCVGDDDCLKRIGGEGEFKIGVDDAGSKDSKESKMSSISRDEDDDPREFMEMNPKNSVLHHDYDDAEALSDEIDEQFRLREVVFSIKRVIDDRDGKSDEILVESLRQLQLMPLSVDILEETKIGKSVNALRKHGSKEIRNLVRRLIIDWKHVVDEWAIAAAAIAGGVLMNEPAKTSADEEEGLPSPPMDEEALIADPTSIELSHFFDGLDEDGNVRNCGEFNNAQNGRTQLPVRTNLHMPKVENPNNSRMPPEDLNGENRRKHEFTTKRESSPSKPIPQGTPKPSGTEKSARKPRPTTNNGVKVQQNDINQKKPLPQQEMRLEASKRKLHENYREAENAKKQRTIQVLELCDIPKQGLSHRGHKMRFNNHNRQRGPGRW